MRQGSGKFVFTAAVLGPVNGIIAGAGRIDVIRRGRVRLALNNGVARANDRDGATAHQGHGFGQTTVAGANGQVELIAQDVERGVAGSRGNVSGVEFCGRLAMSLPLCEVVNVRGGELTSLGLTSRLCCVYSMTCT